MLERDDIPLSNTQSLKEYVNTAQNQYPGFNKNFKDIANYFGYTFKNGQYTSKEVGDFLYEEIKRLLDDQQGDFQHKQFANIRTQLIFEEFVLNQKIDVIYAVSEIIWDATRCDLLKSMDDKNTWIKCCEIALAKRELGYDPYSHKNTVEELNFSKAAKFFIEMGIRVKIVNGEIYTEDKELYKILDAIEYRANSLGNKCMDFLNEDLSAVYHPNFERFQIQRKVNTYQQIRSPIFPYGYMLNIAAKVQTKEPKRKIKYSNLWKELKEITTNFVALYQLEPYTPYGQLYGSGKNFLSTIQQSVLFDNIFLFKQTPFWIMDIFLSELFNLNDNVNKNIELSLGISTKDVLEFYRQHVKIIKNEKAISLILNENDFFLSQSNLSRQKIKVLFELFSRTDNSINKKYRSPFDYIHSEIDNFPIIKIGGNEYKIPTISLFSMQYYERYACILREYDKSAQKSKRAKIDSAIGDNMELVLASLFEKNNINFFHGEKYNIDHSTRQYLSSMREEGECDFIIETDKTIFFMELKKKALTRRSSSGYIENILYDMALSFLSAQEQIGYHECILKNNGEIIFQSGKKIILNNRVIQRVSVSLFDFHALQDQITIDNIFYSLMGSTISSSSTEENAEKNIKKLQGIVNNLSHQFMLDGMDCYRNENRPYANIRYFSLSQIFTFLKNCKSNDDFEKEINVTRCVTDGTMNWYSQYERFRGGNKVVDVASSPKLNNAMIQV